MPKCIGSGIWQIAEKAPICFTNICAEISLQIYKAVTIALLHQLLFYRPFLKKTVFSQKSFRNFLSCPWNNGEIGFGASRMENAQKNGIKSKRKIMQFVFFSTDIYQLRKKIIMIYRCANIIEKFSENQMSFLIYPRISSWGLRGQRRFVIITIGYF